MCVGFYFLACVSQRISKQVILAYVKFKFHSRLLCPCSDYTTGWEAEELWLEFWKELEIFLFSTIFTPVLVPNRTPVQKILGRAKGCCY
jgi:hypothetical protein